MSKSSRTYARAVCWAVVIMAVPGIAVPIAGCGEESLTELQEKCRKRAIEGREDILEVCREELREKYREEQR
jgi:hypothetical protein